MTAPKATGHTATIKGELNWLLDDLVDRVASIRKALVLSGDGLPTGVSRDLTREDSEHLAAVASGFHSLAKGVGRHFEAGNVRQLPRRSLGRRLGRRPGRLRDDAPREAGGCASGRRSAHRSARGRVVR